MKFFGCLFLVFTSSLLSAQNLFDKEISNLLDPALKPFYFGVASGDPQQNSVIIWTKVWNDTAKMITVSWEVATDSAMTHVVASNEIYTSTTIFII